MADIGLTRSQLVSLGVDASRGERVCWGGRIVDLKHSHDPDVSRPYLERVANGPGPLDDQLRLAKIAVQDLKPSELERDLNLPRFADASNGAAMRAALCTLQWPQGASSLSQLLVQAGATTWDVAHTTADSPHCETIGLGGSLRYLAGLKECDTPLRHSAAAALQIEGSMLGAVAVSQAIFGKQRLASGRVSDVQNRPGTPADVTAADIACIGKKALCTQFVLNTNFNDRDWRSKMESEQSNRLGEIGRVFINRIANDDGVTPDYGPSTLKDFAREIRDMLNSSHVALGEAALTVLSDPQAVGKTPDQLMALVGLALYDEKQTPARDLSFHGPDVVKPVLDKLALSGDDPQSELRRRASHA